MKKRLSKERRHVVCPNCGNKLVPMNKMETIHNKAKGFFAWYICPRRRQEKGCGYSVLLEISPRNRQPQRTVVAFRIDRTMSKKQRPE